MAVVISSSLVVSDTAPLVQPLNNARIGYDKAVWQTLTASDSAAGFPASAIDNELTYSSWKPFSLPATLTGVIAVAKDIDYVGIAAHTLGADNATIKIEYWDGAAWVLLKDMIPPDNSPIMILFGLITTTQIRITLSGAIIPRIGVLYVGKVLDMQRGIYAGHTPITLSRKSVMRPNASERGQWLGRSIVRAGSSGSFEWQNLKAEWYRTYFDPFVEHARIKPFFIAWRPENFPKEIAYCWTSKDIAPSNSGRKDFMSVSFSAEGLAVE